MQLGKEVVASPAVQRQAELSRWLILHGHTQAELARIAGVCQSRMSRLLKQKQAPSHIVQSLIDAGVPGELLPEACDRPPGRKAKAETAAA